MKRNPFLKAEKAIIKKVYGNAAILNINVCIKTYDSMSGALSENKLVFHRKIYIRNPHNIADAVVDKVNYLKGDLSTDVAFREIKDAIIPMVDDPGDITNYRKADSRTGGIDESCDTLSFNGITYRIIKLTPKGFYAGSPTKMNIQLRAV